MDRVKSHGWFSAPAVACVLIWTVGASAGAPSPVPAGAGPHQPDHQIVNLGDFRFENGVVVKDFKVSYVTHGKLNPKKDNVILVTDAFTATHHMFDFLKGPGKALDTDKYFIVSVDGLGNPNLAPDITSGPTNSGLKMDFPRYTMRDAVNVEYKVLKEHLGIDHLLAMIGGSMGAMKAFQLAVSYPTYVSGIIPVSGGAMTSPQIKAMIRNWMDIVALDPAWHGGNYEINPTTGLLTALMNYVPWYLTPQWFALNTKTEGEYVRFKKSWHEIWTIRSPMDARDIYYRWRSWADFNLGDSPGFNGDARAALRSVKAQVLIIGSKDDLLVNREDLIFAKNAVPNSVYIEVDSPFGHLACFGRDPEVTKIVEREVAKFLSKLR